MQYSKPMIELVYEIRRRVPSDLKPSVKLANPELLSELAEHYRAQSTPTITKALIKELLAMAGPAWQEVLERTRAPEVRRVTKVYRGQVRLEDVRDANQSVETSEAKKPRLIYRGRVVD